MDESYDLCILTIDKNYGELSLISSLPFPMVLYCMISKSLSKSEPFNAEYSAFSSNDILETRQDQSRQALEVYCLDRVPDLEASFHSVTQLSRSLAMSHVEHRKQAIITVFIQKGGSP